MLHHYQSALLAMMGSTTGRSKRTSLMHNAAAERNAHRKAVSAAESATFFFDFSEQLFLFHNK